MSEHELQNGKADHDEDDEEVPVFVSPGEPGVRAISSVCYGSYQLACGLELTWNNFAADVCLCWLGINNNKPS